ncbi:ABC transporter permease [Paenibacillus nasutitermitis]|uniref:Sugar ABC transporter permease n=1 Tax=Paenibacillus nasutitermitis TaxID=1652958 RepID=A0A917DLY6_9BACL|nr:ABC transporter permease subunit [Paenibacillus nasutitermitis]GGD47281.1 sugar ABC transporter permease [Paenibacillus nasutitermitis]
MRSKWKRELPLHLLVLPSLALILIYSYVPMFGLVMAFQKFTAAKGFFGSAWVGLDNFKYVFELPGTMQVIWNTVLIAGMKIVAGLIVPVTIALLLNEVRIAFLKRGIQTLIYLPHFLSWIILGGILIDILSPSSGIINQILVGLGIDPIFFLGDNRWFRYVLVISDVWKEFGFSTIVYLAALTNVSPMLYEAAVIDGATRWKQTLYITLPGILPIVILMTTLSLGNVLNAGFEQVFTLYNSTVYETGDILDTLVYRIGVVDAQYSVATAVGLFKSFVSLIFISVSYLLAYRLAGYRIF